MSEMMRGQPVQTAQPYLIEESGARTVVRYALPWALGIIVLLAGWIAHRAWGEGPALPWITAALAIATLVLTWLGWREAQTRHLGPTGRAHVAGTIGATGLWLLLATVLGPFTRGVIDSWGLLAVCMAVSWNVRCALQRTKGSTRSDDDGPTTPRKAGKALLASLGLHGEDLKATEVNEHRIGGRLLLTSGNNTVDDATKKAPQLATALGIPKSGVRFVEDPNNAAEADFSFTLRDVLTKATPWPGATSVGGTVFDPIPMGLYETGERFVKTVADKAGAKHELIQGTTGSGKSSGERVEMCELMTRREVALIIVDTEKGTQSFGAAAAGLAWFITDPKTAERFFKRLKRVIKQRASYLGAHGLDAWQPGCGLTFLVVQIEEASNLFAEIGDEQVELLVKAARSAGISIKVSLQRPDHTQISTTLRAQLGTISCYGMSQDDPVCLLPEAVLDAGASPQRWGDRQPGCCYVSGTGITVGKASTPLRTYEITPDVLRAHAEKYGPHMDPIDGFTIQAFGELWANRVPPTELVARLNAQALRAAGMPTQVEGKVVDASDLDDEEIEEENDVDSDDEMDEVGELTPEEMGVNIKDDDPDGTSIDDPIESLGHEIVFREPAQEVSPDEARAVVADRIAEFEEAGKDTIRVPDFADLVVERFRSRAWFRKELLRLVKEVGRLVDEGDGEFRIVPVDPSGDDQESAA